jgi:hypothetical protein
MIRFAAVFLFTVVSAAGAVPASGGDSAQKAHVQGVCGSLGPGTGLRDGKGWIVSMLPGKHELRMAGGGEVRLTAARVSTWDFDSGRPYYIAIEGAKADSALEWKVPGKDWARVPTAFLYPPSGVTPAR